MRRCCGYDRYTSHGVSIVFPGVYRGSLGRAILIGFFLSRRLGRLISRIGSEYWNFSWESIPEIISSWCATRTKNSCNGRVNSGKMSSPVKQPWTVNFHSGTTGSQEIALQDRISRDVYLSEVAHNFFGNIAKGNIELRTQKCCVVNQNQRKTSYQSFEFALNLTRVKLRCNLR